MELEKLKECLEKHLKWLKNEAGGKRADLCGADLRGANMCGADLCEADLRGADLRGANLCGADLCGADLRGADLREANLCGADLRGADLREANLCGADLCGADLRGADLREADLSPGLVTKFFPLACPEEGAFIAWKKCCARNQQYIVKLLIPEDALRSSAFGRKCRASKAECLEIQNIDGTQSLLNEVRSGYDAEFMYCVGETVSVDNFDTDRTHECAPGIHFFITRQEAIDY